MENLLKQLQAIKDLSHKEFEAYVALAVAGGPQWRDTFDPNTTWIECNSERCKVMSQSVHHMNAAYMAIRIWNTRWPKK